MTDDDAPASWLDAAYVVTVLGADLAEPIDTAALDVICEGTRGYVEDKRSDLIVVDEDAETSTFTPTTQVRLGAAMLAHRFYHRRTTPLGILGFSEDGAVGIVTNDPDIGRLLGIGKAGRFVFGAAGCAS